MEFHSKLLQPLPEGRTRGWNGLLPFYMTYPDYRGAENEARLLQDLEYLQQIYPGEVKRCQRRIAEILDRTDYEGSVIYDEYPDRLSLLHLADSMRRTLEQEGLEPSEDVVQLLLLNEVYKRRHGGRRGRIF